MVNLTSASKHAGKVSDLLRTIACSSGIFYGLDNTLSFAFECNPFTGADPKAGERLKTFLNGNWPKNTVIQFTLIGLGDVMEQLQSRLMMRSAYMARSKGHLNVQDQVLWAIAQETDKFLRRGINTPMIPNSNLYTKDYKLIISFNFPCDTDQVSAMELQEMRRLRSQAKAGLTVTGFAPYEIDGDQYLRLMSLVFNHSKEASWRQNLPIEVDPNTEIREQIPDFETDVRIDRSGFWLGDTRASVYSPKRYPKLVNFGMAAQYIGDLLHGQRGLHSPFILTMNLHFGDPSTEKQTYETKGQLAQNQRASNFAKYVSSIRQRADDFDLLNKSIEEGNKSCRICTTMVLFSNDMEDSIMNGANAQSYWSEVGYNLLPDKFIALPLFLNALPMGASVDPKDIKELNRYKTMTTQHVTCLLPIFADWKGTGTPINTLVSRNGQLINVSPFDSSTNYNGVIAAESGAGKSFWTNEMIQNCLATGGRAWVIDVGRSYEKLCDVLDGRFISFGEDSDICINPFPLVNNYEEEEDILVGLVCAMASASNTLSDFQVAAIKRHLAKCWKEKGKELTIDDLEYSLLNNTDGDNGKKDRRITDIGQQLYAFTSKGNYGKFFNGKNTLDLDNRFIVLELEELKGRGQLQQVVLLQLIYQIQQEMYHGDRGQQKMVLIDEAWDLLNAGDVSKFIEHGYRRFRKYGGSCIIITQSMMDLLYNAQGNPSAVGIAIRANSANTYLLSQKNDQIKLMQKNDILPLGDGGYELLKSVNTRKGIYSEILVHTEERGAGIGRLIVDPFRSLLYTTNPEDVGAIDHYRKRGLSVVDSIYAVMEDRNIMQHAAE